MPSHTAHNPSAKSITVRARAQRRRNPQSAHLLQQEAGDGRAQVLGDALGGGVRAVGGAERVVHVDVGVGGQLGGGVGVGVVGWGVNLVAGLLRAQGKAAVTTDGDQRELNAKPLAVPGGGSFPHLLGELGGVLLLLLVEAHVLQEQQLWGWGRGWWEGGRLRFAGRSWCLLCFESSWTGDPAGGACR